MRVQVRPPSVERLASTALVDPGACVAPLNAIAAWCTVPSGAKLTHGSLERG